MSSTEKKSENPSTQADVVKTGIVENKKSLDSLSNQKVDSDNIQGGVRARFKNDPASNDPDIPSYYL